MAASSLTRSASEDTPLVSSTTRPWFDRLCFNERGTWVAITVSLLFVGKATQPFLNDAVHVTQAALVDDTRLSMSESGLGALVAAQDLTEGFSKLAVGPVLRLIGARSVWLLVLGGGFFNALLIATTVSKGALYAGVVTQALLYAWAMPATTQVIAGWVDGHELGRTIGTISVATKLTPSLMSILYATFLETSWTLCYYFASGLFGLVLLLFALLLRPSALSIGFREPSPPGKAPEADSTARSKLRHPLQDETQWSVLKIVFCMRRTWALTVAFCFLVLLKAGAKFSSIYAGEKLGVSHSEGAHLFTTYAVASVLSGVLGGVVYDIVPGGKVGIGIFMTALNVLNLCGFLLAWCLELKDAVTGADARTHAPPVPVLRAPALTKRRRHDARALRR